MYCFCSCDSVTFLRTKAVGPGGLERELGGQCHRCTHCPRPVRASTARALKLDAGEGKHSVSLNLQRYLFSPTEHTNALQQSPKEKVCISAEFSVCQKLLGIEQPQGNSLRFVRGSDTTLHPTVMVGPRHTSVQTHRMCRTEREP